MGCDDLALFGVGLTEAHDFGCLAVGRLGVEFTVHKYQTNGIQRQQCVVGQVAGLPRTPAPKIAALQGVQRRVFPQFRTAPGPRGGQPLLGAFIAQGIQPGGTGLLAC